MNSTTSTVGIERVGHGWRLSCAQRVPAPVETVFPFFATPQNLERLTPSFLRFRLRRPPVMPLQNGSLIDYRLQLHGIPVWWRTRIEDLSPPLRFIDVQVRGPFRQWRHVHEFLNDDRGTLVRDTVVYDVYCRRLYSTKALGWIDSNLRRIFKYRQTQIASIFGGDERRNDHEEEDGHSRGRAHSWLGLDRGSAGQSPVTDRPVE